jgi:hypothetical protein
MYGVWCPFLTFKKISLNNLGKGYQINLFFWEWFYEGLR